MFICGSCLKCGTEHSNIQIAIKLKNDIITIWPDAYTRCLKSENSLDVRQIDPIDSFKKLTGSAVIDIESITSKILDLKSSSPEMMNLHKFANFCVNQINKTYEDVNKYFDNILEDHKRRNHLNSIVAEVTSLKENDISKYIANSIKPFQPFEIAKEIASRNPEQITKYIKYFGITNQAELIEIAKIASLNDGNISKFIKNFGIIDQNSLYNIAKIAAVTNPIETVKYLDEYDLTESFRFELAKIVIDDTYRSAYNKFNLTEEHRFEIAKTIAKKIGHRILNDLPCYRVNNEIYKYKIAKIILQHSFQNPPISQNHSILSEIKNFLEDCETKNKDPLEILTEYRFEMLFDFDQFIHDAIHPFSGIHLMLNPLRPLTKEEEEIMHPLMQINFEKMSENFKIKLFRWIGYYILKIQIEELSNPQAFVEAQKRIDFLPIVKEIMALRNAKMRYEFTGLLFQYLFGSNKCYEVYNHLNKEVFTHKNSYIFKMLLSILIHGQGEWSGKGWKYHLAEWDPVFSVLKLRTYKNASAQMIVFRSIYALILTKKLEISQKICLLLGVFSTVKDVKEKKNKTKIVNNNLLLMDAIINLANKKELDTLVLEIQRSNFSSTTLKNCLKNFLGGIEIDDFPNKLNNTFLRSRNPFAFFSYVGALKNNDDSDFISSFPFIRDLYVDILNGKEKEERYKTNSGDHLSTIFSWKEGFKDVWEKGIKRNRNKASDEFIEETDSWEDLLLCGTEVDSSCLNINGSPIHTRDLLNYMIDGKYRIVLLRDSERKIRARVLIRILWDRDLQQPVLFREEVYKTLGVTQDEIKELYEMCLEKAESLGIPICAKKDNAVSGSIYPNNLVSLNSRAPYEYIDILKQESIGGTYEILKEDIVNITRENCAVYLV